MAGLMATGVAAPAWASVDFSGDLVRHADEGVVADSFGDDLDDLKLWVDDETRSGALVVVTPGTADTGLGERTAGLTGNRENWIVRYPESIWPVSSGTSGSLLPLFAPTYDHSRGKGVDANVAIMRALRDADRVVVYTGYSQGADALGNAAERAYRESLLDGNDLILLVSDPRGPWGLKPGLQKIPGTGMIMALVGAQNDGARDPGDAGGVQVVQVIVRGDPVANWQWDPLRPMSSLLVDAAGFITIHAGTGVHSYANLRGLTLDKKLYSADGNTTYEVYDTYHPLALLNLMIAEALGIPVSDDQLAAWDRQAERFYPLQDISPETAAPGVTVVKDPPTPTSTAAPEATSAKHRLLGVDGRQAEAPVTVSSTPSAATYVPRHAAPYEPRHAAPEAEESAPEGQESGGTAVPDTAVPETGGTDEAGSDAVPESEAPEPVMPAADTTAPDTGSDTTDGETADAS